VPLPDGLRQFFQRPHQALVISATHRHRRARSCHGNGRRLADPLGGATNKGMAAKERKVRGSGGGSRGGRHCRSVSNPGER
jgi:hypothetical protein